MLYYHPQFLIHWGKVVKQKLNPIIPAISIISVALILPNMSIPHIQAFIWSVPQLGFKLYGSFLKLR